MIHPSGYAPAQVGLAGHDGLDSRGEFLKGGVFEPVLANSSVFPLCFAACQPEIPS